MVTLFDHRYGTHGTTSVIIFLSRFSQHVVRVAGRGHCGGVEELAEEGVWVGVVLTPGGALRERDVLVGGLDGGVRTVDRTHLERDAELRGRRLNDRDHPVV